MKGKISILLFGGSFIIAILGEAYLLNVPQPHLFSIIGIGIVVVLTGYLFFDSIWEHISDNKKKREMLWMELIKQETEKWDNRYTELLNIQKATYVALKKSYAGLEEQIKELSDKLIQSTPLQKEENILQEDNMLQEENIIQEDNIIQKEDHKEKAELEIKPLNDDPNAALSADEIQQLFNNYGQ